MYYLGRNCLNWNDDEFWDSSPKFLFKQLDLYTKFNSEKPPKEKGNKGDTKTTKEVKKYKVLDSIG